MCEWEGERLPPARTHTHTPPTRAPCVRGAAQKRDAAQERRDTVAARRTELAREIADARRELTNLENERRQVEAQVSGDSCRWVARRVMGLCYAPTRAADGAGHERPGVGGGGGEGSAGTRKPLLAASVAFTPPPPLPRSVSAPYATWTGWRGSCATPRRRTRSPSATRSWQRRWRRSSARTPGVSVLDWLLVWSFGGEDMGRCVRVCVCGGAGREGAVQTPMPDRSAPAPGPPPHALAQACLAWCARWLTFPTAATRWPSPPLWASTLMPRSWRTVSKRLPCAPGPLPPRCSRAAPAPALLHPPLPHTLPPSLPHPSCPPCPQTRPHASAWSTSSRTRFRQPHLCRSRRARGACSAA